MRKLVLMLTLLWLCPSVVSAQVFEARVNRSEIPEGETFMLMLDLKGASTNNTPDVSALGKDFTIYSISNAYRTNIVNNQVEQSRQWNLVLMPKNTGNLTIPAIKVDSFSTEPVQIKVAKAGEEIGTNDPAKSGQPRFYMEGEVDNLSPYVQQQINYTLTIYDTGGLQGDEPSFMVGGDNWIIKNLGAPQIKNRVVNGKNLREIKFYYALFAQKSGELTVPEVRFNGYYLSRDSRKDPFGDIFKDDMFISGFGMADVFATRNPVVLTAKPIKVDVRPAAPENNGNWWLPAEEVKLYAEFSPVNPIFKIGEAVNRTIYLKATGIIDTQLPEINFGATPGLKQYPEKPETKMTVENGKVISLEKISNVYIPNRAGAMTLPEVSVEWFNVRTGKMEKAALPSMQIEVLPGTGMPEEKIEPVTNASSAESMQSLSAQKTAGDNAPVIEELNRLDNPRIYLLLGAAFGLGILLSFILMRIFGRRNQPQKIHNYKKYIIAKAREKDLRGLRDGILEWAAEHYQKPGINSLKEVEELCNSQEFSCELEKLTEALYARSNQNWKNGSFIKAFEKVSSQKVRKKNDTAPLPKLYK